MVERFWFNRNRYDMQTLFMRGRVEMDEQNSELVGDWLDEHCPRCGATLLGNKRGDKWCSNAGGVGRAACAYGLELTKEEQE